MSLGSAYPPGTPWPPPGLGQWGPVLWPFVFTWPCLKDAAWAQCAFPPQERDFRAQGTVRGLLQTSPPHSIVPSLSLFSPQKKRKRKTRPSGDELEFRGN